jgi:serine/threonine protein kinase
MNPSSEFWQPAGTVFKEDLVSNTIFGGQLQLLHPSKGLKSKHFILTNSSLYLLSRWRIPKKKVCISWKTVEAFEERTDKKNRYGFRIRGHVNEDFYASTRAELEKWLEKLSKVCICSSFEEDFYEVKEIKRGASSKVKLCRSVNDSADYAVKCINKSLFETQPAIFQGVANEISVLRRLNHPNIVKLYKVYETRTQVKLVMEYLPAGDLLQKIQKKKRFTEAETLKFMGKLLQTLNFLHEQKIVHRDLKLDNIALFSGRLEDFKIIDFGLASDCEYGLSQKCGTPGWIAPEVLQGCIYDCKVDVFSAGVLMHTMLAGKFLFHGKSEKEILKMNSDADFNEKIMEIRNVSQKTMRFLQKLLQSSPERRINSSGAIMEEVVKTALGDDIVYTRNESIKAPDSTYSNYFTYESTRLHSHVRKL